MDTYCQNFNKYGHNKNITGQELAQILNKRYTDRNFGLSVIDSIAFFQKFNLGLKVINIYYKLTYEFKPEKYNHNINVYQKFMFRDFEQENKVIKSFF